MADRDGCPTKPYQAWVFHGEGWSYTEFDTPDELRNFLLGGGSYGSPIVLTRLLEVRLKLTDVPEST